MIEAIIGIIGSIILVSSWIPQVIKTIRSKKAKVDVKFNTMYIIGIIILTIYTIMINNMILTVLNIVGITIAGINLYYTVKR